MDTQFDVIVIGSGAAGTIAAIKAARDEKKVLLLEKLPQIAAKLKATGGGKCNLTNTLSNEEFMSHFGKNGRFMTTALKEFDHHNLIDFLQKLGVKTHAPDGLRVFPTSHNSQTVIDALSTEIKRLNIKLVCNCKVENLIVQNNIVQGVQTSEESYKAKNIIIATGGYGYPKLGAQGDGYEMAKAVGHNITKIYPAMMPLNTKESWIKNCRADTIPKVTMYVDIKKYKKYKATGDLIFTSTGIRGPVVLDFAREITPLFDKMDTIPLKMNLLQGMNEDDIIKFFKQEIILDPQKSILEHLSKILPQSLIIELSKLVDVDYNLTYKKLEGQKKSELFKILASTPLTISGHDGFKMAMITRGGISLKQIDPSTMRSKLYDGLYFCGEVVDLDGPCGGYNLQWAFASGYLAGELK